MPIRDFDAHSLAEVHIALADIYRAIFSEDLRDANTNDSSKVLWYRGQDKNHDLLPSLLRFQSNMNPSRYYTYEEARTAEELLTQQFSARSHHIINQLPDTNIEWQEVMQHYETKTRIMDWSENLHKGLLFALEPFITASYDVRFTAKRQNAQPVLWVLHPAGLNGLMRCNLNRDEVIEQALMEFPIHFRSSLKAKFNAAWATFIERTSGQQIALNNVISLSRLEELRTNAGQRILFQLLNDEFNPIYYLILRVYSDGIKLDQPIPPIAILHPYHSVRIENQKGAFTIFPMAFDSIGNHARPMNHFDDCDQCLCRIRLLDPDRIAQDMRLAGYSYTDLYPEMFEHSRTIVYR